MTTRWAIVGSGRIAQEFAADMSLANGSSIAMVTSRDQTKAKAFAAAVGPDVEAGTFEEALTRDDIDAVYIATPNHVHAANAIQSIEAGKPVLIEKPIATTGSEADRIADAAKANKVLAMEAMWMRFTPSIVKLKQIVESGEIGEIRQFHANLTFPSTYHPDRTIFHPDAAGAGLDLGVYPTSLMVHLLGLPQRFERSQVAAPNGASMTGAVTAVYDDAIGTAAYSLAAEGDNQAVVVGTKGVATVASLFISSPMVTIRHRNPAPETWDGNDAPPPLPPRFTPPKNWSLKSLISPIKGKPKLSLFKGRGLYFQVDHFAGLISQDAKESSIMPLAESAAVVRMVQR